MAYNANIHQRHSIRLKNYDYTQAGAYFITLVAWNRENIFGKVVEGEVKLTQGGECVAAVWQGLPGHFPVCLGESVVMPNHFHGIIILNGQRRGDASGSQEGFPKAEFSPDASPLRDGTVPGSLNAIVQNFKSVSARKINRLRNSPGTPVWQRNYYEHVIRGDRDWAQIAAYIVNNPAMWEDDNEYR